MKMLLIVCLIFLGVACSQSKNYKVNYHSKNIFDLEIYTGKIVYFCSEPNDPEEPRQFLNIYLLRSNRTDLFFTRRKLEPQECKNWVKEMDAIYQNSKTLRIVGTEGNEESYLDEEISTYLRKTKPMKVSSTWFFSRIVTDKGCVGHFGGECVPDYSEKKRFIDP